MADWIVTALFVAIGLPAAIGYGLMAYHAIPGLERPRDFVERCDREDAR